MKSHPLAPVFAMALLLAILLWLCSSCEKPTTLKSSDIKAGALTVPKDHAQLIAENANLRKKLKEQEDRANALFDSLFEKELYCQEQIDALIAKCNKKDQQIKILTEK